MKIRSEGKEFNVSIEKVKCRRVFSFFLHLCHDRYKIPYEKVYLDNYA